MSLFNNESFGPTEILEQIIDKDYGQQGSEEGIRLTSIEFCKICVGSDVKSENSELDCED